MAETRVEVQPIPMVKPGVSLWHKVKKSRSYTDLVRGLWADNPTYRMVLGMCPTLAVTNTAVNSVAMGLATMSVTIFSSVAISIIRRIIPRRVRLAVFMIIIATLVTFVDLFFKAVLPDISEALGAYVGLIITNCIILGRAEAFASINKPWYSFLDALGVGLGFTASLTILGMVREFLGFGTIFYQEVAGAGWTDWAIMIMPPGAFLTLGVLYGIFNSISKPKE